IVELDPALQPRVGGRLDRHLGALAERPVCRALRARRDDDRRIAVRRTVGAGAGPAIRHGGSLRRPIAGDLAGALKSFTILQGKRMAEAATKNAIVSDDLASKFATEKDTPYTRWVKAEGLDIIGAHYLPNLHTVDLKPWPRRGGKGVYINHEASRTSNDCYVCEIPPGGQLAPQRQLFEEMILILDGRGSTTVWNDAGSRITFEWKAGALFAIP